jgi:transposase, IS5 family
MCLSAMLEANVAHRSIGQDRLGFASETRSASSLDGLLGLIDWDEFTALLGGIHANGKGEAA